MELFYGESGLSADEGRVAIATDYGPAIWDGHSKKLGDGGGCDTNTSDTTLAGKQGAFICVEQTNTLKQLGIIAFTIGGDSTAIEIADLECHNTCLGNIRGKGKLLVYTSSRRKPVARWRLWRIVNSRKVLLRSETTALVLAAVDTAGTRIVVQRPSRRVEILKEDGAPIVSIRLPVGRTLALFLDGTSLIRRTERAIEVIDASNGALRHRWLLPRAAALEDVEEGRAVYLFAGAVHFLRFSDGLHTGLRVVGMQNPGPDHVQLQPQGLFVARTVRYTDGLVAFIPRRAFRSALR